jgi:hypothetical protein
MNTPEQASDRPDPNRGARRYLQLASEALAAILARPDGPFRRAAPPGTVRGIDFYRASRLLPALANALAQYERHHGRLPNLARPAAMTEKLLWAKFFVPVPVPSPGDKLAVGGYVPENLRGRIERPSRPWIGDGPRLPGNDAVPPGDYFLKASHGSGFLMPLRYPLSDAQRELARSKAARWLATDYGTAWGEWWYAPVKRRVFLERRLGDAGEDVPDWKLWVIGGRVRLVHVVRDRSRAPSMVHYTRDFERLEVTRTDFPPGPALERPRQFDALVEAAEAIGRAFCFARVDCYLPDAQRIVLGEITLCPDNARIAYRPLEFDYWLGEPWDLNAPPAASASTG